MADNTITVVGNITRDPELKFLNSGQAAIRVSIAVNRRWQNRQTQEWEERVSYFEVAGYGSMAENAANSLTKGTRVIVSGRLEQRSWETEAARSARSSRSTPTRSRRRCASRRPSSRARHAPKVRASPRATKTTPRTNEPTSYAFDEEPF